jgi:hypothetical protein
MTATIEQPELEQPERGGDTLVTSLAAGAAERTEPGHDAPSTGRGAPAPDGDAHATPEVPQVAIRPLLVAACSSLGAGLTIGGIFGSWAARLVCVAAGLAGVGWAWLSLRSSRRAPYQLALPIVAVAVSVFSVTAGAPGGPSALPRLIREAINSGRVLRPPIPFDAGWRPILITVMMFLGFAAALTGTTFGRPRLALVVPLPLLGLAAISQPKDGQALAGLLAVLPVVAGLTVLFGASRGAAAGPSREFELRRIIKAALYVVGLVIAVLVLNTTSLLFPEPTYNPAQQAQKPKPVPLSAAADRVLFEVSGPITGPWKMGSLSVYDGTAWRLPAFDPRNLVKVPDDGVIDSTRPADVTMTFTIRDLGTNATLPGVTGPTKIDVKGPRVVFEPAAGSFRVRTGRVPAGLTYKESLPTYPTPEQLRTASVGSVGREFSTIPNPPPAVRALLDTAPSDPWDRLDFVLKKLTAVEIAVGEGRPKDVPPAKVEQLLAGNHEGSPYELVAAKAMLARWAGVPSRIGFGFDGVQQEGQVLTVRPKNAAQWLEVYFEGHGWIPIVTQPPRAKASLDNDKNAKFNPTIQAGSDVAVQVYIPVKVKSIVLLYQKVRAVLASLAPFVLLALLAYVTMPWVQKTWRRAKRRRWAARQGVSAQIAVEYCEFRDLATDLGIGDPYATPIEYLDYVVEDDEHQELAWLVTKALYGELHGTCVEADAAAAGELVASLAHRLTAAQPFQTRVLAALTRLSLERPFSTEVPNVRSRRLTLRFPRRLPALRRRRVVAPAGAS